MNAIINFLARTILAAAPTTAITYGYYASTNDTLPNVYYKALRPVQLQYIYH